LLNVHASVPLQQTMTIAYLVDYYKVQSRMRTRRRQMVGTALLYYYIGAKMGSKKKS